MWGWLREFYEIRLANHEARLRLKEQADERLSICQSCEVLKIEISKERREKEMLLNHLLTSRQESAPADDSPREPMPLINKRHIPWKVRQQELEQQDRQVAQRIMSEFKDRVQKSTHPNTDKLEESIGLK